MKKSIEKIAWALSRVEPMEKEIEAHTSWMSAVSSVGVSGLMLLGDDLSVFKEHCNFEYYRNRKQP